MDKETSSRVSSIASEILNLEPITSDPTREAYNELLDRAQTLAGSGLSQDQTPGQEQPEGDFLSRLKLERAGLSGRLDALALFLQREQPDVTSRHREMLKTQFNLMSELLAVLDERIADIEISRRSENVDEK